ncbi:hypothetical protein EDC04DRAFT_2748037 [Pisolithus marmoratus]|nr:hypothetical protein EDC04DRAFT_2748037 [Pisolithus marmoratus]
MLLPALLRSHPQTSLVPIGFFLHVAEVTFSQYLALLTVGDAFMVTSLREGMALRTHELC